MGSHECSELPHSSGEIPAPSRAEHLCREVGHIKTIRECVVFEPKTLKVEEDINFHFCFILKSKLEQIWGSLSLFFFFFLSVGLGRKPVL